MFACLTILSRNIFFPSVPIAWAYPVSRLYRPAPSRQSFPFCPFSSHQPSLPSRPVSSHQSSPPSRLVPSAACLPGSPAAASPRRAHKAIGVYCSDRPASGAAPLGVKLPLYTQRRHARPAARRPGRISAASLRRRERPGQIIRPDQLPAPLSRRA